jgi:hypothetical protein
MPHQLEAARVLVEVDLRGDVTELVRGQPHPKPPPHSFVDCQSERVLPACRPR